MKLVNIVDDEFTINIRYFRDTVNDINATRPITPCEFDVADLRVGNIVLDGALDELSDFGTTARLDDDLSGRMHSVMDALGANKYHVGFNHYAFEDLLEEVESILYY